MYQVHLHGHEKKIVFVPLVSQNFFKCMFNPLHQHAHSRNTGANCDEIFHFDDQILKISRQIGD